jgi:hypothetical protein
MFSITACWPVNVTVPFAFDSPAGASSRLSDTSCNCRRPFTAGLSVVPVTAAFSTMLPDEKMSGEKASSRSSFTLPLARMFTAFAPARFAVPVTEKSVNGPTMRALCTVTTLRSSATTIGAALCSSKVTRGLRPACASTECASSFDTVAVARSRSMFLAGPLIVSCPLAEPSNGCCWAPRSGLNPE